MKINTILVFSVLLMCMMTGTGYGNMPVSDLWIKAVIHTVEKGDIEAMWHQGGEGRTTAGDQVVWGYFYANPKDVSWGSEQNPDVFVKIWMDHSGRVDVNFFHVSVPEIDVYSAYPYSGTPHEQGTVTVFRRYMRHYYQRGESHKDKQYEDSDAGQGASPANNPPGDVPAGQLRIGAVIKTEDKGDINAIWYKGGDAMTERGDQVIWGYFYANPKDVTWGSPENPDVFVKIWFDVSGRTDVNFFHVSVPDIEVYSAFPDRSVYDQKGKATLENRYIRHEYCLGSGVFSIELPPDDCRKPASATLFNDKDGEVIAWVEYCSADQGKNYRFEWYNHQNKLIQEDTGVRGEEIRYGCSWERISTSKLHDYPGRWTVKFYYDNRLYWEGNFDFSADPDTAFELREFLLTEETPNSDCTKPKASTAFSAGDGYVTGWADYAHYEAGKTYKFKWYSPANVLIQENPGKRDKSSDGCSWGSISTELLNKYTSGKWRAEFCYDERFCTKIYFDYSK